MMFKIEMMFWWQHDWERKKDYCTVLPVVMSGS